MYINIKQKRDAYPEIIKIYETHNKINDNINLSFSESKGKNTSVAGNNTHPTVTCPYCHSANTSKISTTSKVINTALFGIFGNKRKHQWHCNGCGSDF